MRIIQTNSLDIIIQNTDKADHQTLVIFDINHVLIHEESAIFTIPGRTHRHNLAKTDWRDLTMDQINNLWSIILQTEPVHLVDEGLPHIIASIKSRSIPLIALTSCASNAYGNIPCMMDWSIQRLAKNKLCLQGSFVEYESQAIEVKTLRGTDSTQLKAGILFNGRCLRFTKGEILEAFLKHINWQPSHIILVDNQIENLESVSLYAERSSISFVGIHYTAFEKRLQPYNEKLAHFQFNYLREHGIWLPDHQALTFVPEPDTHV